ncbi:flagellar basal-body rod protein FlgB [Geoalkalibacter ferrihydriticus]|uniref:Flagellar basal body rod protein FlgB n=2 Tax=Geoalkalibacter ferrihydriticus TaxID=392333 RepID=A0A0C2EG17_9BACT|nr:flagellar basal body rod protein FlgB [Geoalkalibacter ferrihydriticus]KIH77573.1 flagellar basal-body rod protein FlgB [Geoalkalibacter ferrihydriticus DSM 17813]SDL68663.1 flagellar basal-body rod protein FlgB [Geoalkalibacter ferrihydriticus]
MSTLGIFDQTSQLLHKVLDLRQQNQQVIASNIANAHTPSYSAARFEFADELGAAVGRRDGRMSATHAQHFPLSGGNLEQVSGRVLRTPDRSGVGDANNVSVDQEMLSMAENQLLYEAAAQMLSKKLGLLKYVAQDGR